MEMVQAEGWRENKIGKRKQGKQNILKGNNVTSCVLPSGEGDDSDVNKFYL